MKKRCSFIRKSIIAVFCTFTAFSHCVFGFASNDDEYITFDNFQVIQAYRYFSLYGFSGDTSYQYNDVYTTTGSYNISANISLSGTNGVSFTGASNNDVLGMIHNFHTDDTVYNLVVNGNSNVGSINYYGSTNSLHLACTYSNPQTIGGAADSEYQTLTCTDPNFNDAIPYYVTLYGQDGTVRLEGYNADDYAIFRRATDDNYNYENDSDLHLEGLYSFSGSLSVNESGSLSGSGSINLTTTTTNINNLKYVLPYLQRTSVTNATTSVVRFRNYNNNPFIVCFLSKYGRSSTYNQYMHLLNVTDNTELNLNDYVQSTFSFNAGYSLSLYETKPNMYLSGKYLIYSFDEDFIPLNAYSTIPVYVGYKNQMSDDIYRFIYGSDRLIELLEDGNNNSQQKEQALNTQTTQMQNKMTQFQNIEDAAGNNMNTALNNINTNPSLLSTNKFLVSVDWIRQQYNRIVTNTPFEAVITFCLVFGLGLLLLGKVR